LSRAIPSSSWGRRCAPPSNCTNQDGEAKIPSIPQGKILVQVIAKGYQTFGQTFDVNEDEKTLDVTLNPPQQQYSAHE